MVLVDFKTSGDEHNTLNKQIQDTYSKTKTTQNY